jgi:hypothetical protein
MSRCLGKKALVRLYYGEGSEPQQAHVGSCQICAKRYQRLADELLAIKRILRQRRPPHLSDAAHQPIQLGFARLVTVLTVAVVFLWGSMFAVKITPPFAPEQPSKGEVWQFLGEVSSATLPLVVDSAPTGDPDFTYLRQALGEE